MSNFPTNYTISEVTYNNVPNGSTVSSLHPTAVLLITPLSGYTLDYSEFSVQYLPPNTTSVVFTQSGLNIVCTVNFDPTFIMPANNVEIPLCINGMGELIEYSVSGSVYAVGDANVISTPGSGVAVPFSNSAILNTTTIVYTGAFTCAPGYYMSVAPTLMQTSGNNSNFTITYNNTYNGNGLLIGRAYTITYLTPNYGNFNNNFSIAAASLEIYVPELGIVNYILSTNTFPLHGGIAALTLYGIEGSAWNLSCIDPILQTGPIDPITGIIPYGTSTSGVIDSSGQILIQVSIGISSVEDSYSITLGGDISPLFAQPNPILLYQFSEITITYRVEPTSYFIGDGDKTNVGYGLSSPNIGDNGFINDFYWNITALADTPLAYYELILLQQPLTTSFNNLDPIFNGGNLLSIDSILATQTSGVSITLNVTGEVESYGISSMLTSINPYTFIAPVLTSVTTSITTTTATSGSSIDYLGSYAIAIGQRGVCYSTIPTPTVADLIEVQSTGLGVRDSPLTDLIPDTMYYVRAYVYNSIGDVFYGNQQTFTTLANPGTPIDLCYDPSSSQLACDCGGCANLYNGYLVTNPNAFNVTVYYYDEFGILQNAIAQPGGPSTWCSIGVPFSDDPITVVFENCDCLQ